MSELQQSEPTISSADEIQPRSVSMRERLRRPFARSAAVFVIGLIIDRVIKLVSPDSIERLSEFNTQLAAGAKAIQPWYGVALFWQKLTSNWPADITPAGTPFFLLGRAFGAGVEAIMLPLSEGPGTAIPALVGYGLGFYVIRKVYDHRGKELNLLVGIVGTIFIGALCLFVLQPVMIVATGVFGSILGTVSTNTIVLATIVPLAPVGSELIKHILEERAEAVLNKALDTPNNHVEGRLPRSISQEEGQSNVGQELTPLSGTERSTKEAGTLNVLNREPSTLPASKSPPIGAAKAEDAVMTFALKPLTEKLVYLVPGLGLIFVFAGPAAIFYDNVAVSIPLILLGLVFLIYLSPKTGTRLRWKNVEEAKQTDFFRWFSMMETGTAKDETGRKIVIFRPDGEKFHDVVSLDLVLHEYGTIAVAHLTLAKAFVDDPMDGIFARDIAKSFIRAAIPAVDEGSVADVANDIEYRHDFSLITGVPAAERPQLPPEPTSGFLAFVGEKDVYKQTFRQSRIRIEQVSRDTGSAVEISIGAGRDT